jgi:metal-responsive CopG/Arc/MetJ family transcriptional regulator
MKSNSVLGISLPKQIVTQIDEKRGDVPRSRYLLRILENVLEYKDSKMCKIEKNNDHDRLDHNAVESEVVNLSASP